jgi:Glycosyltransferase
MLKLHIVSPYQSVAMQRMTAPLVEGLKTLYETTISDSIDPSADVNYHIPWHTLIGLDRGESVAKHAMLYTHCNPTDWAALYDACERADQIICMSFQGRRELVELGADPAKMWVIYAGSNFAYTRRNIGIIGSDQPNGRKRFHILLDLIWKMSPQGLRALNFVMVGDGLEGYCEQMKLAGAVVSHLKELTDDNLADVYAQLDALIVTGYAEGGPLPLMEAFAAGVPVFSPDIGYASDFLEDWNLYETVEDLSKLLHNFLSTSISNNLLASALNWNQYITEHAVALGRLCGVSAELTKDGADRYAQVLDIIRETKAQRIVEVGTWSGARAVQMIQEAAKHHPIGEVEYAGFDLFEQQTGESYRREFSKQAWPYEVVMRRLLATRAKYQLITGPTSETMKTANLHGHDLYFIDGGHSVETITNDWGFVSQWMKVGSVAIFDDYYDNSTNENIGCNKVVEQIDLSEFDVKFLPVVTETEKKLLISMVKVTRIKDARIPVHGWKTHTTGHALNEPMPISGLLNVRG